ncbi:unnamed protein product, partial [Polarella glacialis]
APAAKPAPKALAGPSPLAAKPAAIHEAGARQSAAAQDRWFQREVLGALTALPSGAVNSLPLSIAIPPEDAEAAVREAMSRAQMAATRKLEERLISGSAKEPLCREEEPMVLVQGKPYTLAKALADEELQDSMTDDEYQRFVDLDKETQRKAGALI